MKKVKKFMFSPEGTLAAFAAATVLLLLSSVGGARAALTYYSENHMTEIRTQRIGVTLVENNNDVAVSEASDSDQTGSGELLKNLVPMEEGKDGTFVIGQKYKEELGVKNSGQIEQYVRVTIYKYWVKKDASSGKEIKQPQLDPGYIDLELNLENSGWVEDETARTAERTVLYYTAGPLGPEDGVKYFAKSFSINPEIVEKKTVKGKQKIYDYQGCEFRVKVDVDAVQTHNAEDAIQSAWGKNVTVDKVNGSLSGIWSKEAE